jgi:hypothetical protein
MERFTQQNIEKWLEEFVREMPLTPANAEKFNIMCKAMKNLGFMHMNFTEEDAKEWAKRMNPPARWTMDQTTAVMQQRGYNHKPCEFWVVMNMLASDYGKTMAKYGADRPDVWADLAHDWIEDADAIDGKVGRYWRDIVRHE